MIWQLPIQRYEQSDKSVHGLQAMALNSPALGFIKTLRIDSYLLPLASVMPGSVPKVSQPYYCQVAMRSLPGCFLSMISELSVILYACIFLVN